MSKFHHNQIASSIAKNLPSKRIVYAPNKTEKLEALEYPPILFFYYSIGMVFPIRNGGGKKIKFAAMYRFLDNSEFVSRIEK